MTDIHEATMDYNEITPNIYVGSSMCCTEHGDIHNETLKNLGISAEINLREKHADSFSYANSYLWLPIIDDTPPSLLQAKIAADFIQNIVDVGEKVYIHCNLGHGRAPTITAAYFILKKGFSPKEAVSEVILKRPEAHPMHSQIEFLDSLSDV